MMRSYGITECISSREAECRRIQEIRAMPKDDRPYADEEVKEAFSSDMDPRCPPRSGRPVYFDDDGCEWCDNLYIKPCSRNCMCIAFACYIEAVTKQRTACISKSNDATYQDFLE